MQSSATTKADFYLNRLMEVQRHNLLHTVFDHLCGEEVCLPLFVHRDLSEVLQQNGTNGFGRVGHVNGPVVTHHLTHVG